MHMIVFIYVVGTILLQKDFIYILAAISFFVNLKVKNTT